MSKNFHPFLRRSFFKGFHRDLVGRPIRWGPCLDLQLECDELGLVFIIRRDLDGNQRQDGKKGRTWFVVWSFFDKLHDVVLLFLLFKVGPVISNSNLANEVSKGWNCVVLLAIECYNIIMHYAKKAGRDIIPVVKL
jgi:hypothetical protein